MKQVVRRKYWPITVICLFLSTAIGCSEGPKIGRVQGTLTVDGKPTSNLAIFFYPAKGRMCRAITDAEGHYELRYKPNEPGVPIGRYRVVISTVTEEQPVEQLPVRYNRKSELTAEVAAGTNNLDFALDSK